MKGMKAQAAFSLALSSVFLFLLLPSLVSDAPNQKKDPFHALFFPGPDCFSACKEGERGGATSLLFDFVYGAKKMDEKRE